MVLPKSGNYVQSLCGRWLNWCSIRHWNCQLALMRYETQCGIYCCVCLGCQTLWLKMTIHSEWVCLLMQMATSAGSWRQESGDSLSLCEKPVAITVYCDRLFEYYWPKVWEWVSTNANMSECTHICGNTLLTFEYLWHGTAWLWCCLADLIYWRQGIVMPLSTF